jgi:hypothetical protein
MANIDNAEGLVLQKRKTPFAARAQNIVLALLVLCMLLVAQPFSLDLYGYGVYALAIVVFLQIAVSNVAANSGVGKTIRKSVIIIAVIAILFAFSIWVTPILVGLGR